MTLTFDWSPGSPPGFVPLAVCVVVLFKFLAITLASLEEVRQLEALRYLNWLRPSVTQTFSSAKTPMSRNSQLSPKPKMEAPIAFDIKRYVFILY